MMASLNEVKLIGRLGRDPEVRYTASQKPVATLSVATSKKWKDKTTGEKKEKTEWHRVVLFDRMAEIAQQYLKKGAAVFIDGELSTRKWQGQDGQDRYTTEIIANDMQMLDPPRPKNAGSQQAATQAPPAASSTTNEPPAWDEDDEMF